MPAFEIKQRWSSVSTAFDEYNEKLFYLPVDYSLALLASQTPKLQLRMRRVVPRPPPPSNQTLKSLQHAFYLVQSMLCCPVWSLLPREGTTWAENIEQPPPNS